MVNKHKSIIGMKSVPKDIGILEYYSNVAKVNNMPIDTYISDYVSRTALVYSVNQKNSDEIKVYINNDEKMIDFLLDSYKQKKKTPDLVGNFISQLKM